MRALRIGVAAFALLASFAAQAADDCMQPAAVCVNASANALALIDHGAPLPILADGADFPGVLRAARDVQADLSHVAGHDAAFSVDAKTRAKTAIIVGTLGKSARIDKIVRDKHIDAHGVRGVWEGYLLQVVDQPEPGIDRALVVIGADKRGTIFGLYELSRRIGVSPWQWWADVPVAHHDALYAAPGRFIDAPQVKYRGIFINDEDPALGGLMQAKFGGPNQDFYAHVFELILRLKGNLLWPAMWGRAFFDDDPQNPKLADEYGVVIGTSHHEPMMRANIEWRRYGKGAWDYTQNADALRDFWRKGIERMGSDESLVTVGMRGDGDEPMTQGTAISLLENIVADQRRIIGEVTRKPVEQTPQVWALYKEVQDYFDAGMRVPDDVTLLFSDDNWGNLRRLPKPGDAPRAGGYGIYYHFDYVGDPRNYKWIDTTQIERTWEQMHLAYAYGARQLWIVNVGDIKPLEFPISFFLDNAWKPEAMTPEKLGAYPAQWAAGQFGAENAREIGDILTRYTRYNARRKPELLDADTYDLASGEAERVEAQWSALVDGVARIKRDVPQVARDAYFELVEYPVLASANLNAMYFAQARNHLYARQGDAAQANRWADEVQRDFDRDAELQRIYEHDIAGGKWPSMMSQTRIGYTGWQQPDANVLPATTRLPADAKPARRVAQAPKPEDCAIPANARGFVECNGIAAIEAEHYADAAGDGGIGWLTIPNLGRTLSAVTSWPQDAKESAAGTHAPHLDYPIWLQKDGEVEVRVTVSPSLDFRGGSGLRFGVSIGDEAPQVVTIKLDPTPGNADFAAWEKAVSDSVAVIASKHVAKAGAQTLHLWRIDPGVAFQRIEVLRKGAQDATYLGAPESAHR